MINGFRAACAIDWLEIHTYTRTHWGEKNVDRRKKREKKKKKH